MWNKQPSPGLQEAQETSTNFLPDPGGGEGRDWGELGVGGNPSPIQENACGLGGSKD